MDVKIIALLLLYLTPAALGMPPMVRPGESARPLPDANLLHLHPHEPDNQQLPTSDPENSGEHMAIAQPGNSLVSGEEGTDRENEELHPHGGEEVEGSGSVSPHNHRRNGSRPGPVPSSESEVMEEGSIQKRNEGPSEGQQDHSGAHVVGDGGSNNPNEVPGAIHAVVSGQNGEAGQQAHQAGADTHETVSEGSGRSETHSGTEGASQHQENVRYGAANPGVDGAMVVRPTPVGPAFQGHIARTPSSGSTTATGSSPTSVTDMIQQTTPHVNLPPFLHAETSLPGTSSQTLPPPTGHTLSSTQPAGTPAHLTTTDGHVVAQRHINGNVSGNYLQEGNAGEMGGSEIKAGEISSGGEFGLPLMPYANGQTPSPVRTTTTMSSRGLSPTLPTVHGVLSTAGRRVTRSEPRTGVSNDIPHTTATQSQQTEAAHQLDHSQNFVLPPVVDGSVSATVSAEGNSQNPVSSVHSALFTQGGQGPTTPQSSDVSIPSTMSTAVIDNPALPHTAAVVDHPVFPFYNTTSSTHSTSLSSSATQSVTTATATTRTRTDTSRQTPTRNVPEVSGVSGRSPVSQPASDVTHTTTVTTGAEGSMEPVPTSVLGNTTSPGIPSQPDTQAAEATSTPDTSSGTSRGSGSQHHVSSRQSGSSSTDDTVSTTLSGSVETASSNRQDVRTLPTDGQGIVISGDRSNTHVPEISSAPEVRASSAVSTIPSTLSSTVFPSTTSVKPDTSKAAGEVTSPGTPQTEDDTSTTTNVITDISTSASTLAMFTSPQDQFVVSSIKPPTSTRTSPPSSFTAQSTSSTFPTSSEMTQAPSSVGSGSGTGLWTSSVAGFTTSTDSVSSTIHTWHSEDVTDMESSGDIQHGHDDDQTKKDSDNYDSNANTTSSPSTTTATTTTTPTTTTTTTMSTSPHSPNTSSQPRVKIDLPSSNSSGGHDSQSNASNRGHHNDTDTSDEHQPQQNTPDTQSTTTTNSDSLTTSSTTFTTTTTKVTSTISQQTPATTTPEPADQVTRNRSQLVPLNPPESSVPVYIEIKLQMTWNEFCNQELVFCLELVDIVREDGQVESFTADQIRILESPSKTCALRSSGSGDLEEAEIEVQLYLVNKTHHYDVLLTRVCFSVMKQGFELRERSVFKNKLIKVQLLELSEQGDGGLNSDNSGEGSAGDDEDDDDDDDDDFINEPGVTIVVAIAAVGGVCCAVLIIMQIMLRRRYRDGIRTFNRSSSVTSVDSIALNSVIKSRPHSGHFNPALDLAPEQLRCNSGHSMSYTELSAFALNLERIYEEFQMIPNKTPRLSVVPCGAEDKNRFANILPIPDTRVRLETQENDEVSSFINANYVSWNNLSSSGRRIGAGKPYAPHHICQFAPRNSEASGRRLTAHAYSLRAGEVDQGYSGQAHTYIATQAPLDATVGDFWTMVWQQQCPAIVMLINPVDGGHRKCATYFPDSTGPDCAVVCGDFSVVMTKRDVHQEYITSWLQIKLLRTGEIRCVRHFWLTCWPLSGRPEPISLVRFVLDSRPQYEDSGAPLVVHCSNGTARTGTFIALDICMRQYEDRRTVDVMRCVSAMRQERAGCIQTSEQYSILYQALNEYATILSSPGVSAASSATTLHAMLP